MNRIMLLSGAMSIAVLACATETPPLEDLSPEEVANLPEDDRIRYVVEGFGWSMDDVVIEGDYIVIDGDILLARDQIDSYISMRGLQEIQKGYVCNSTFGGGANGAPCVEMKVTQANKIGIAFDNLTPAWRNAFIEAAYVWSTANSSGYGTQISIDAHGKRASNQWTITVRGVTDGSAGPVARSSWPGWVDTGFVAPGNLIFINKDAEWDATFRRKAAIHEIGHALGYAHPGQGDHIPWTQQWTADSTMCNETDGVYDTVMCQGQGNTFTFMSRDDVIAAYIQYPGDRFDRTDFDWEFCTPLRPCSIGEGDCDTDADCAGYLVCSQNAHAGLYGVPAGGDVCVAPATPRGQGSGTCEQAMDGNRCDSQACPCGAGEGDCDTDQECGGGLVCNNDLNNGPAVGIAATSEVCTHMRLPGCAAFNKSNIDWELCTPECPCSYGEGDCDVNADCVGDLVCGQNVGAAFGLSASLDLCIAPGVTP